MAKHEAILLKEKINKEPVYEVTIKDIDGFGEAEFRLNIPLNKEKTMEYIHLKINGHKPVRFSFAYRISSTISGTMTNISMKWGSTTEKDLTFIHAIGFEASEYNSIVYADLYMWLVDAKNKLSNFASKDETK